MAHHDEGARGDLNPWCLPLHRAGGSLKDALGVCAHELADPQLALFVSRVFENKIGPSTRHLIEKELLPGGLPYSTVLCCQFFLPTCHLSAFSCLSLALCLGLAPRSLSLVKPL